MAPSPEQGQPKAPDKSSSAATSAKHNANETSQQQQQKSTAVDATVDFNMTSTASVFDGGNSSSNSCSGATQEVSSKNLKRMNDADFKVLLDEAFSYKSPKDREKKSETFRRLLDNVERNKDHQFPELSESRYQRGTNNQHGGSLQDLKESGANEILDTYTYGKNNRRQHHNSRTLKYSLVSTRQREGGSLPSNVNVYNCFLTNEPKFLNEVGTKRRGKAERTFSGASSNSGQDSIVSYESKDDSILGDHTAITEIDISEDGSQPQVDENGNAIVAKKKKKFDADRNTTTVDLTEVKGYRGHDPIETLVKFIENSETSDSTKKSDKLSAVAGGGKKKDKKKEKDPKKDMHKMKKSTSLEELRSCTKLDEDDKSASGVIMRTKGKKNSGGNLASSSIDGKENIKQNTKRGERRSWGTEELTYLGENNAIEEVREKNKEKEKAAKKCADKQPPPPPLEKCDKLERAEKMPKKKKGERSLSVISMESAHSETAEFHVVTKKKRSKKRQSLDDARTSSGKVPATFPLKPTHTGHKKYQSSNSFSNDRDSYLTTYSPNESRRKSTSSVPPSEKSDSSDLDSVHSLPIESVSGRHQSGGNGSSQMQHQSYADIARTVNASKNAALWQAANNVREKDKWPAVSAASTTSNTSTATNVTVAELCSNTIQTSSATKQRSSSAKTKSLAKDFPDLAIDRNGNKTSSSYDGASTCSSSSSTSTIVRQISYSQSLGDEKIIGGDSATAKVVPLVVPTVAATTIAKLTDVVRGNENTKQTLQKSKSADNERFYSVEQYPALEKTVKRHSTQNPISDIRPLPNPANGSGIVSAATQQALLAAGKQRMSSSSSTSSTYSQTQHQQSISTPLTYGGTNVSPNTIPSFGSTGAVALVMSSNDSIAATAATTANSALSDTSKIVINNNLDMNTKIAATSSSSSNSLGNVTNSSTNSSILVTNNGKKSKPNTKVSSESSASSSSLVEVKNAMNSSLPPSQAQTNYYSAVPAEDAVVLMNHTSVSNANPKKSTKSDSQQVLQQTVSSSGNPTIARKSKRDKYHQAAGTTDDMSQTTLAPLSHGKHSNRPAVIILNEASDGASYGGGDFTFGDFNEEELRLFECNNHLDDSGNYNAMTGPDVNSSGSIVSDNVHEDVHLSPHSDLGYSSSNNRSILSESMDQNNISSTTGAVPPKMGTASACPASEPINSNTTTVVASHLLSSTTNEHNDYKMSLPNDSAIIMASKNPSISSHFASSALLQSHANMVPTKLFNTSSSSSSSSANKKVLSNNIAFSANHNKYKDPKTIEFTEHDLNVTSNSSHNLEIVNNSNIENDISSSTEISGIRSSANNNGSMETLDNCTRTNYPRRSSATGVATIASTNQTSRSYNASSSGAAAVPQKSSCDNNTMMKRLRKEVNIRFIAPPITHDINSANYEKLVDFVGLAWEDVMHGVNGDTEYYDGQ